MQKYDADQFSAMFAAGYTPSEAIGEVHKFYEKQEPEIIATANEAGRRAGYNRSEVCGNFWGAVTIAAIIGTVVCVLAAPAWLNSRWYNDHQSACAAGNAITFLEGVQDQANQAKSNKDSPQFADTVARFRLAYRLKTGAELPEK